MAIWMCSNWGTWMRKGVGVRGRLRRRILGTTYGGDGVTTFALPDLRGRDIIGASATDPIGAKVGQPTRQPGR
jgi:hypothetical protein